MAKYDFEAKLENSKKLLNQLSNPDITLSKSIQLYKEGLKELENANKMLEDAKLEFEELYKDETKD
jgi:exodeoxyribonuclease VII small subunit